MNRVDVPDNVLVFERIVTADELLIPMPDGTIWVHDELRVSNALVKFCVDHGDTEYDFVHVQACAAALAADNPREAVDQYRKVYLGGMGAFNDYCPEPVFAHEDEDREYARAVFEALVFKWSLQMSNLAKKLDKAD